MMWFIVALSGTLMYVLVTYVDKYITEAEIKDPLAFGIISGLVSLFVGALTFVIFGFGKIDTTAFFILIVAGILMGSANYLYFFAISKTNISDVTFLLQLIPVFVLIFAYVAIGETIGIVQLFGFGLVLVSVTGIIMTDRHKKAVFDKTAIILMVGYDLLYALSGVMIRSVSGQVSFKQLVMFEATGYALVTIILLLLFKKIRLVLTQLVKTIKPKIGIVVLGNEGVLFLAAKSLMNFAYTLAPAALVSIVESSQAMIALLVGVFLTFLFPKIFKENTSRTILTKKIVLSVFAIVGLWFTQG